MEKDMGAIKDMNYSLFRIDKKEWWYLREKLKDAGNRWGMPFYLFSEDKAKNNVEYLRHSMGNKVQIVYAMKANPWLVRAMDVSADFIEVCSEGELEVCRQNRIDGKKIIIDGTYKSDTFIKKALAMKVKSICVESADQLEKIIRLSEKKQEIEILLRISSGNQFGVNEKEFTECIYRCRDKFGVNWIGKIKGIQYYPGTQRNQVRQIYRELERLKKWIFFLEEQKGLNIRTVEFGSGIGVPYFEGEKVEEYEKALELVSDYAKELAKDYTVLYESGRNIAASCGIYVTKVFAKKKREDKEILFCYGGTHHLHYHGGTLGVREPFSEGVCAYPIGRKGRFMVCGSLCSAADILIHDCKRFDKNMAEGDYIVFFNAGAYCPVESPNLLLSMEMPSVLLYNKNNGYFQEIRGHLPTYKLIQDRM